MGAFSKGLTILASATLAHCAMVPPVVAASGISVAVVGPEAGAGPASPLVPGDSVSVVVSGCARVTGLTSASSMAFKGRTVSLAPSSDGVTLRGFPTISRVFPGTYTVSVRCGTGTGATRLTVAKPALPGEAGPQEPGTVTDLIGTGIGGSLISLLLAAPLLYLNYKRRWQAAGPSTQCVRVPAPATGHAGRPGKVRMWSQIAPHRSRPDAWSSQT